MTFCVCFADSTEERLRLYDSLESVEGKDLQQRLLDFAVSDSVRSQDTSRLIRQVASGSTGGADLAWQFFRSRLSEFRRRYRQGPLLLRVLSASTCGFASEEAADEIEAFFAENTTSGVEKTPAQIIEATK